MGRHIFRGLYGKASLAVALAIGSPLLPLCQGQEMKLRQQLLDLNKVTGKTTIAAMPLVLSTNPKESKKVLAEALLIAREKNQPLNYNAGLILGKIAADAKDYAAAEVFFRISMVEAAKLQSHNKLLESYGNLIDTYYDSKKFADAARVCKELLDLKTDDGKPRIVLRAYTEADGETDFFKDDAFDSAKRLRPSVLRIYVQALAKQGKHDQALKVVDDLLKERSHWLELQLKGRILHEAGRYEEAVKVYEEVLRKVAKDKDLDAEQRDEFLEQYRYSLSSVLIDMNKIDEASDILQKLIDGSPRNPSYYNDLGYIWANKNMRLPEAEKLIRKALELDREQRKAIPDLAPGEDKDNGAYLDSLGWVLFRQQRFKEAKEALLKAVEDKSAQHIEIYDHLGDTYQALGDIQSAQNAWRKGLEHCSDSRRDQERKLEVEKKLKQSK